MNKLTIATCQFPVCADIAKNKKYVLSQMKSAEQKGADVAHFPEAALSGILLHMKKGSCRQHCLFHFYLVWHKLQFIPYFIKAVCFRLIQWNGIEIECVFTRFNGELQAVGTNA